MNNNEVSTITIKMTEKQKNAHIESPRRILNKKKTVKCPHDSMSMKNIIITENNEMST